MTDVREEFITALVDLDEVKCLDIAKQRLEAGEDPFTILEDLREGTDRIGKMFEDGRFFVSDLMMAGEILKQIMEVLKPAFGEREVESKGTVIIGTVEGDVHDIGKNIVIALLEAEGFTVIDLGVDQPPSAFIDAIKEYKPLVVSLSGLLTEAIDSMKKTIDAIDESGLRGDVKIIIGGGRTDGEAKDYTGADDWSDDATAGVRKIKELAGVS